MDKINRKIITFCGSTRFKDTFYELAREYTLMGWIVLMPHCYFENNGRPDLKELLVSIHRDMIKISDAILVINVDGYIGYSTKTEIEYAKSLNKEIRYITNPEWSEDDDGGETNQMC